MAGPHSPLEPTRGFWIGTAVLATLAVLGCSLSWRLPRPPERTATGSQIQIRHARIDAETGDRVLREEALVRDPTPLFLPTRWSAAAAVRPESVLREPGENWGGFKAQLVFPADKAQVNLPLPTQAPETSLAALQAERWEMPFLGWGQRDGARPELSSRRAQVEVVAMRDGRTLLTETLAVAPVGQPDWEPIEWLAAVEPAGPVGAPALLKSSGQESVDRFYADYLEKTWRLGERLARLAPGFYHIKLGP